MVQSSSWEANWFAASQEIPRISRNPKVHYRTHKCPPPVSILGQPNPVHIPTFHLLEIHPNIIHPSTPRSPQWSPSLRFPHQDHIHPLSSPIRSYYLHTGINKNQEKFGQNELANVRTWNTQIQDSSTAASGRRGFELDKHNDSYIDHLFGYFISFIEIHGHAKHWTRLKRCPLVWPNT